jgi:ABC-2 type transport system ATP-binding protein
MLEGMGRSETRRRIPETMTRCFLEEVQDQIIGTLSKGYRQRVGLAAAILHHPKVLVLDEPTVGLDPKQIIAIRELILELGRQQTLLLSSHILPEVELICDRVIIIDRGRIIAEGSPEDLRESWLGSTVLRVELKGDPPGATEALGAIAGVVGVEAGDSGRGLYSLECAHGMDPREAVFQTVVAQGWTLLELAEEKASLEEIFVRLTTQETAATSLTADSGGSDEEVVS